MVGSLLNAKKTLAATPSLVIDLPTVESNLQRLAGYAQSHGISIRPHTKTHKSRYFAGLQKKLGARGLTVAKVGEAIVMSDVDEDILVAYPAVDPYRATQLAELARRKTVRIAIDSEYGLDLYETAARQAGSCIGILVDQDVGFHRTGMQTPHVAFQFACQVTQRSPHLRLDGLFFYPGHVWSTGEQQVADLKQINSLLEETIDLCRGSGIALPIVSGGSTPTAYHSHLVPVQTEIRPGTYLFNDANTLRAGFCQPDDCAAAIVCTVVSTSVPGKAVIDAGTKVFTSDRNVTQPESGHGICLEYPDLRLTRLSEEHGELDLRESQDIPKLGERITFFLTTSALV